MNFQTMIPPMITTATGKEVSLFSPRTQIIDPIDIAISLSRQNRFLGHTKRPYNVAEHCLAVCGRCSEENKAWGLLHDAAETYLGDIPSPMKCRLTVQYTESDTVTFKELEGFWLMYIAHRFGLRYPVPVEVNRVDKEMIELEQRERKRKGPPDWYKFKYLSPPVAEMAFLAKGRSLGLWT